jgi:hypothetical protein
MLIVIGKVAYVRDFSSSMTVMTLMTMICELILDGSGSYILHRRFISWTFQLSHSSGACPSGYWDDNLCHHCHHFWQGTGPVVGTRCVRLRLRPFVRAEVGAAVCR